MPVILKSANLVKIYQNVPITGLLFKLIQLWKYEKIERYLSLLSTSSDMSYQHVNIKLKNKRNWFFSANYDFPISGCKNIGIRKFEKPIHITHSGNSTSLRIKKKETEWKNEWTRLKNMKYVKQVHIFTIISLFAHIFISYG